MFHSEKEPSGRNCKARFRLVFHGSLVAGATYRQRFPVVVPIKRRSVSNQICIYATNHHSKRETKVGKL
jgi:hypothetical protein